MGIIDEIRSMLRAGADIGDKIGKVNTRSVARGANEQSFNFQCLMENTIDINMCTTLAKNFDRLYASWTQIYLSSVGCIDLNYIKNPKQFIAKYQPRLVGESGDSFLEECMEELKDGLYGDSEFLFHESGNMGEEILAYIGPGRKSLSKNLIQRNNQYYLDGYNSSGISGRSRGYFEATTDDIIDGVLKSTENRQNGENLRNTKDSRAPRVSESEIKKVNDMSPYMLELRLLASKGDSSFSEWVNFIIGVKTTLHLGSSNMLMMNIVDVLRNRNPMFNFIRWTTGEISLVKDLILHLDDINFDIANKTDRTGKFISGLKRMKKEYLKFNGSSFNRLAPQATIVISSATYQEIKDNYGFDLKNMTFASKVLSNLFLMCFVILDDVNRTCDILVDGQHDFQTYSLDTLEREVAMNSNKLSKELMRMLGEN